MLIAVNGRHEGMRTSGILVKMLVMAVACDRHDGKRISGTLENLKKADQPE